MNYKECWEDTLRWLEQGIEYLEKREIEVRKTAQDVHEHIRIRGNLDGLRTTYQNMKDLEKIYKSLNSL